MKYVLGIDLGTSGTKTVLFDQYGTAVCSALVEYPLYQPHNGWAEQKPEDWYHAAVDTIRSVLTKSGVDKKDVVSMGISGQMHGLVMLDEADSASNVSLAIISPIFSVATRVSSARLRISSATTANPLPASPARAASIDAFRASKLV